MIKNKHYYLLENICTCELLHAKMYEHVVNKIIKEKFVQKNNNLRLFLRPIRGTQNKNIGELAPEVLDSCSEKNARLQQFKYT